MANFSRLVRVRCGGARGWRQRSNVSMMIMCPPQHGHGGRTVERFVRRVVIGRRRDGEQFAGACEAGLAGGAGEQAVVADAVEAARQDVEQEAADELVGRERHDLLAVGAVAAIILVAEGDAGLVEGEQPAVRDGDAVGVARQIGEHGLGARRRAAWRRPPSASCGPARGGAGRPAGRRVVRGCRRRRAGRRRAVRSAG